MIRLKLLQFTNWFSTRLLAFTATDIVLLATMAVNGLISIFIPLTPAFFLGWFVTYFSLTLVGLNSTRKVTSLSKNLEKDNT